MHVKAAQSLVNAQTKVNRAVFAMNEEENGARRFGGKPTPTYILDMIHDAMRDLSVARRILKQQKPKGGTYTCLDCGHRGWRQRINSKCPMCGQKATASNTV